MKIEWKYLFVFKPVPYLTQCQAKFPIHWTKFSPDVSHTIHTGLMFVKIIIT